MIKHTFVFLIFSLLCLFAKADDIEELEIIGNKFFYKNNGSQFLIRGVAYQQRVDDQENDDYQDPLADGDKCSRDVKYLTELNTNVIRVYAVDPEKDHDACMKTFADAGIYVIADLSAPNSSISRSSPSWDVELYQRYTSVVDMFANYTNVLGFFAGNEVTNNKSNTDASAFVKAAVRDMKAYISDKDYRNIPVGYSSNDDEATRIAIADYFACGDEDERADFFGINMYEWCGNSNFQSSGYEARTNDFKNLSIPIFFSEYGCNTGGTRKFTEVGTIYSDKMTDVWSGGIVYMYFEEENNFGLVSVDGSSVSTMSDFGYLSSEMKSISPSLAKSSSAASTEPISCPTSNSDWKASSKLPPTPDEDLCECYSDSLSCVISDDVSSKDYGDLFSYICTKINCDDINADGSSGKYGEVSFCDAKIKLSYVLNKYYEDQNKESSACSFKGSASLRKNASAKSSCSALMASATSGSSNETGSGSGSSGSGSSGSSGSSSSSSSKSNSSSTSSSSSKKSAASTANKKSKFEIVAVVTVVTSMLGGLSFFML